MLVTNIQEWYKELVEMNELTETVRTKNSIFFFDPMYYDWPEYPEFISGKDLSKLVKRIERQQVQGQTIIPIVRSGL